LQIGELFNKINNKTLPRKIEAVLPKAIVFNQRSLPAQDVLLPTAFAVMLFNLDL